MAFRSIFFAEESIGGQSDEQENNDARYVVILASRGCAFGQTSPTPRSMVEKAP